MLTSNRLSVLDTWLILFVLGFVALVLAVSVLGAGARGPTVIQSVPGITQIPVTPEEIQENWEKLVETINLVRDMQKFANAATDPAEKERLQGLADELQKQAEALARWLDSHEAIIPEHIGRMICMYCEADLGASGTVMDSHGVCDRCLKPILEEIEAGKK